jgi:hypothetical protein
MTPPKQTLNPSISYVDLKTIHRKLQERYPDQAILYRWITYMRVQAKKAGLPHYIQRGKIVFAESQIIPFAIRLREEHSSLSTTAIGWSHMTPEQRDGCYALEYGGESGIVLSVERIEGEPQRVLVRFQGKNGIIEANIGAIKRLEYVCEDHGTPSVKQSPLAADRDLMKQLRLLIIGDSIRLPNDGVIRRYTGSITVRMKDKPEKVFHLLGGGVNEERVFREIADYCQID